MYASNFLPPANHSDSCPGSRILTVCVVDTQAADYRAWTSLSDAGALRLEFVESAETALRLARTTPVDLWVVNTNLAGLSGCELCSLLKSQSPSTPVYVIADQYSPADELAAWQSKATLFGCKGGHDAWLHDWLKTRSVVERGGCSHPEAASSPQPTLL